jgi:hypothetical protein
MLELFGRIKRGLSYKIYNKIQLKEVGKILSDVPSKFLINIDGYKLAVCRWVSPKRTRSYPYARIYDIMSQDVSKKVAIIPVVKDEGIDGDRDFLQWDTISLLSLLGIYVIPAYYCRASKRQIKNKVKFSNQQFNLKYIHHKLKELAYYKSDALHWNMKEFKKGNFLKIVKKVKECYQMLSKTLGVKIHDPKGIDKYYSEIQGSIKNFIALSRDRSKKAQRREVKTKQPKEKIKSEKKASITIENYLGGLYYFTIDEVEIRENIVYLIESKHSKSSSLPGVNDIKDGLIKVMLYQCIDELYLEGKKVSHRAVLRLTSETTQTTKIDKVISSLRDGKRKQFFENLLKESKDNNFEVWYG